MLSRCMFLNQPPLKVKYAQINREKRKIHEKWGVAKTIFLTKWVFSVGVSDADSYSCLAFLPIHPCVARDNHRNHV